VKASSDFYTIEGAAVAREGGPVDCPACGTQGVIKCVIPRLPEDFEGKEYATCVRCASSIKRPGSRIRTFCPKRSEARSEPRVQARHDVFDSPLPSDRGV
jgi:hypothetical protein